MCVTETETYIHSDGHREVIESRRPCEYGTASRPCRRLVERNIGESRIVETRPSRSSHLKPNAPILITEDHRGRQSLYRERRVVFDLAKSGRNRSTKRQGIHGGGPSADGAGSGSSSPRIIDVFTDEMPPAPTPPPAAPRIVPSAYEIPIDTPPRSVLADGTANYQYPPTIRNSNPSSSNAAPASRPTRRSSVSTENLNWSTGRTMARPRKLSNIITDNSAFPSRSSSSPLTSPGSSRLPRITRGCHERHDSVRGSPLRPNEDDDEFQQRQNARESARERVAEQNRESVTEGDRRRRVEEEERRQAQLDQERYAARDRSHNERTAAAESDSRDEADHVERKGLRAQAIADLKRRERPDPAAEAERRARDVEARRATSRERRERHRRQAAGALESRVDDEQQRRIEAEFEQMQKERRRTQERESRASAEIERQAYEQGLRDAAVERARYPPPRRLSNAEFFAPASPLLARHFTPRRPRVHHSPVGHRGGPMRDRGLEVLEQEQDREVTERTTAAMGRLSYDDYEDVADEYAEMLYVAGDLSRTASRRAERDRRRRDRFYAFWDEF